MPRVAHFLSVTFFTFTKWEDINGDNSINTNKEIFGLEKKVFNLSKDELSTMFFNVSSNSFSFGQYWRVDRPKNNLISKKYRLLDIFRIY